MGKLASLVVLACLGLASSARAQTATGQITGTVTDSTGGVVQGVKVVVTSQQTGLTRETTTSEVGSYTVPLLPVGIYLVTRCQALD
jgi:Carboxypeptidase regulatory-like domain